MGACCTRPACCMSSAQVDRREEVGRAARQSGAKPNTAMQPRGDWTPPQVVEEIDEMAQLKLMLEQMGVCLDFGVCQALLTCMREHALSAGVQAHAMSGLKNICASSRENQVTVAEGAGIDLIRTALDRHAEEPSVVEQAMWLLRNLVDKHADNTAKFHALVGENMIKDLMEKHSAESNVQDAGSALQAVLHGKGIVNRSILVSTGSM